MERLAEGRVHNFPLSPVEITPQCVINSNKVYCGKVKACMNSVCSCTGTFADVRASHQHIGALIRQKNAKTVVWFFNLLYTEEGILIEAVNR